MKRVAGKTALVTAAGKGIGRASALALVREGATVWATDVDDSALAELAAEAVKAGLSDLKTGRLDVLDTAAVQAFAARTGKVDVLFNCAGFVHHGSILEFHLTYTSACWLNALPGNVYLNKIHLDRCHTSKNDVIRKNNTDQNEIYT